MSGDIDGGGVSPLVMSGTSHGLAAECDGMSRR